MPKQGPTEREIKGWRPSLILLVCFLGLLLLMSLFGDRGLLQLYHMGRAKAQLEREIKALERDNTVLRQEVEAMRRDPFHAEEIARRDLGLVRPGEIVYQFRKR